MLFIPHVFSKNWETDDCLQDDLERYSNTSIAKVTIRGQIRTESEKYFFPVYK